MTESIEHKFNSTNDKMDHKANSVVGQMLDKGKEIASDVTSRVSSGASDLTDIAHDTMDKAATKVKDVVTAGKDYATGGGIEDATNFIKRYPVPVLFGAVAVGFWIGRCTVSEA